MKPIINYINEASRNEKKRNEKIVKDLFQHGKETSNIKNFGILTSLNPNSGRDFSGMSNTKINKENKKLYTEFKQALKDGHYKYVHGEGKFGERESSFVVFNIKLDTLKYYSGKYEQTSFWYCYPKNRKLVCEYYQKKNDNAPYNKKENPYVLIESSTEWKELPDAEDYYTVVGKNFKFQINLNFFNEAYNEIEDGLNLLFERFNRNTSKGDLLDVSINGTGETPWRYRNLINN